MKAVIMAGGFGTRIQPLTSSIPKPMLTVFNRPMMSYIVDSIKEAGIVDVIMLLYFKPDVVKKYFGNGKKFGLNIKYIIPDDDYGTAGAVKKAEHLLDERFIVVSGDLFTDFNFSKIVAFHREKHSRATITLTSVEDPLQFGVIITDKNGQIIRFLEKPGWGEVFSDTINTGIYIFEPEILSFIPANKPYDFSKDLFPTLMSNDIPIFGYNTKGYWRDVGNPDAYREVFRDVVNNVVHIELNGEKTFIKDGACYKDKNVKIHKEAILEGLVQAGKGSVIEKGAKIKNLVLGENTTVGENAELENCITWNNVIVGQYVKMKNSVLCDNVIVGKNVRANSGCIIAENTEAGDFVVFEKDVMVWPNKQIEDGSIVSSNLIWGDKWKKSIFEGGKVSARTNVELSAEIASKLGSATGSILPKSARVIISRDYHRASRMLKRSFLGGLLSTGANAVDVRMASLPVMRYNLYAHEENFGVHFRQSPISPTFTEILFYDKDSLSIDTNMEKNIERIYFRENFRRVAHDEIGNIQDIQNVEKEYINHFFENIERDILRSKHFMVVANLLNGTTYEIYPGILNHMGINPLVLNAYYDEGRLSRTFSKFHQSENETTNIVKAMGANVGLLIFPHGEKLKIITDKGVLLRDDEAMLLFLKLIDMTAEKSVNVYLPATAPDVLDSDLDKVKITRGKFFGLKPDFIKGFYFKSSMDADFIFTEHSIVPDAMFASMKLLEMVAKTNITIAEVMETVPEYSYIHNVINCPTQKKGYLMRKMSEDSMGKDVSLCDGIKINFPKKGWVLMIPDQYSPNIHLFANSKDKNYCNQLVEEYKTKISEWVEE